VPSARCVAQEPVVAKQLIEPENRLSFKTDLAIEDKVGMSFKGNNPESFPKIEIGVFAFM
jgi:hypothetical protein